MVGAVRTIARTAAYFVFGISLVLTAAWGVLMVAFAGPGSELVRNTLAVVFASVAALVLCTAFLQRWRWRALAAYFTLCAVLLAWWFGLEPSNRRDWQPDVAVLSSATIDGDFVTVRNIRNNEYRAEFDFTPRYYDRRFDLRTIEGVDVVAVYWMGPAIAHVFLSFAFAGDRHLAISIEARKEVGEGYSTLKGFFRQYELIYVVADERDVIRLRTNYRRDPVEDVYIYRSTATPEAARRLLLEYLAKINALNEKPEFYNSLTTNCTIGIWNHANALGGGLPFHWKILASGYVPELLYERGTIETSGLPYEQLRQRAHANARGHAADTAENFSRLIREVPATR
jgi:hypothetical protein